MDKALLISPDGSKLIGKFKNGEFIGRLARKKS